LSDVLEELMIINLELGELKIAYENCTLISQQNLYIIDADCWFRCGKILFKFQHYKQALKFLKNSKTKNKEYYLLLMRIENGKLYFY
jgi:tetratricopeptide (TPR) repeat protein